MKRTASIGGNLRRRASAAVLAILGLGLALNANAVIGACDGIPSQPIEIEATAGTLGPTTYATLGAAFAAINAGTHQGVIEVEVCANSDELTTPATLNSSGAGSALYTSVRVRPLADALTISGLPLTGFGVIQLNGADSVTIDGDNPNSAGTNRDLTVNNTAGTTVIANSVIRVATSAAVTSANNISIRNLNLNGNVVNGNSNVLTGTTTSSNSSFGIYVGGNGGASAIGAPTAITSVTAQTAPSTTTINNLAISNNAINQAARGIVINGAALGVISSPTVSNNILGGAGANSGASPYTTPATTIYTKGIWLAGANNIVITGNTLQNILSYVGTTMSAIELSAAIGTPITVSGNSINTVSQNGTLAGARGIQIISASGTYLVADNSINNIQSLGGSFGSSALELGGTPTSGIAERNRISTVYNRNGGTFGAFGLNLTAGTAITVRNNFISDILMNMTGGDAFSTTFGVHGLRVGGGTGHRIYNNSVNLSGALLGAPATSILTSACTIVGTGQTAIDMRNNICANTITGGTTSIAHVSLYLPSAGTSAMNLTLDSNDYFSGTDALTQGIAQAGATPGTGFYLGSDFNAGATTPGTNLRSYSDTLRATTGNDSASIITDPAFVSATDLHITPGSPAQNTGATIASVTNDIDGQLRPGGSGYDIGADEVDGVTPPANDMRAVAFLDPAALSAKALNVAFNPQATVGNNGTTTQASPVRFRIVDPSAVEVYNQVVNSPSIAFNATANLSFPSFTPLTVGVYTMSVRTELAGDTNAGNDLISSTFTVLAPLTGAYTVGAGGNFLSLTVDGGLFQALNAAGAAGNIMVRVISDLSLETGANALNELAGGASLSLRPAASLTPTISGASTGCLIRLNGADSVTLDGANTVGGSSRDLTINNTSTATSAAVLCASSLGAGLGSSNNTFRNLNIRGNDPTQTLIGISLGGITAGSVGLNNNNNRVENCSVQRALFGIYSAGGAAATPNTGTVITQNDLIGTAANRIRRVGILVFNDDGVQITRNRIDGIESNVSGDSIGIGAGTQTVDGTNTISSFGVVNATISRNLIGSVVNNSASGFSAAGIAVAGGATGPNTVTNNFIHGVNAQATPGDIIAGIYVVGATGSNTRLYHNSVAMSGERGTLTGQSASFALAITGVDPTVELKNNILSTTQTSALGGAEARSYAIGMVSTTFANLDANFNLYNSSGANAAGFRSGSLGNAAGVNYATLAPWQAAIADDANSLSGDPLYLSTTDLHLPQLGSPAANAGTPIASVTIDFDGDARSPTTPEIGADEITLPNAAPTITPTAGLSRQQGSPVSNSAIATVTDDGGNGAVMVSGAGTVNGITLSNIVNAAGTVTGDLVASCTATNAVFTLVASDGSLSTSGTLNVAAAANTAPSQGTYGNASLIAGNGTTVNPSIAPSDNGSIASITAAAPGFTGGLSVDTATGVVTVTNAGPASVTPYTVTVTATDNCGATATASFQLTVTAPNAAPTITAQVGVARVQGSAASVGQIATVTDDGGNGVVTVTVNGGASATVNGITVASIVNTAGTVNASVVASCTAANAAFTLAASDGSLSTNATLNVAATANIAPIQGIYGNASLIAGNGTTVNPSIAPSDNGSIASITAAAPGFTGGLSVNTATGAVTVTNAGPASVTPYTVTVTATDNCGATATASFQLTVNASNTAPTITAQSGVARVQGSAASSGQIATVADDGGNGAVTVTVNGGASATVNGVTVSGIVNTAGTINASVVASCTAANAAFTLSASDGSLSTDATLNVAATANTPPAQGTYANSMVGVGLATIVTPSAAPSDNGSVTTITASAPGFTGTLTVNPATGAVSVGNAGAASVTPYTVTVTATDNCGAISTATFALTVNGADLSIVKLSSLNLVNFGLIQYTLVASNSGPTAAPSANVTDTFPTGLANVAWTCVGIGGASCPANGTGNINRTVNLPPGATVVFSVTARITSAVVGDSLSNTATVSSAVTDPNPSNNSSTVTNGIWLFKDGFEAASSSISLGLAAVGITQSVALPTASMTAMLNGYAPVEVLRFEVGTHRVVIEVRQLGPTAQARLLQRDQLGGWSIGEWADLPAGNARFEWTSQAGNALSSAIRGG